ncbi:MAG TPA: hypothetical protein VKG02_20905 [Blastocatellia bacterium]|nr:hypothetical protein [Blastocatellia bacterium]
MGTISCAMCHTRVMPDGTVIKGAQAGFRGAGVKARAVKGHACGLNLSAADRQALIAFLKTL